MDIQQIKKRAKLLPVEKEEEELHCYINGEDLLTEIFIRATAKTIGRCKCVNKLFNSLISNQHFITRRCSRPLTDRDTDGLFHFSETSAMVYFIPFENSSSSSSDSNYMDLLTRQPQRLFANDDTQRCRIILASCCGFLLVHFLDDMKHYYLCNPTTKKLCLCIPTFNRKQLVSPMFANRSSVVGLCIIEPSSSHDNVTNFKLVFVYSDQPLRYRFIIYSKETGQWEHSNETIACAYSNWNNSVYYRGALHWLREKDESHTLGDDILAFHVQKEQARMINIPENMSSERRGGGYGDVWFGVTSRDDLLNMVSVSGNQVVIWVLGDYENMKWQVKSRIETDWIDLTTSLPKFFDGERLVMVENKIVSKEKILFDAHIYNIRTREPNTKKLPLWLDNCRVFVPCTSTLMDM